MPVVLSQLVYTSFPEVGLRTLASTQVPKSIQQAFIKQVVHQHWDSYDPPSFGYQAAYIRQVTLEHTLFGWLYNDGLDDLGRSNVPYFLCYYLAERLHAVQLENIFTCLHRGPVALIERQHLPASLETLEIPDWESYQPARLGVAIPPTMREQCHIALQHRRLIDLFISADEQKRIDWLEQYKQQAPVQSFVAVTVPQALAYEQDHDPIIQGDRSELQFPLLIGIGIGFASTLVIASGSYFFLQLLAFAPQVKHSPVSISPQNNTFRNISLVKTLTGHTDVVWCVIISRDNQTLVSSSGDQTIKLWNLPSGKLRRILSGHTGKVWSIALSPDGQTLASGSSDRTIKLWNLPSGELRRTLSGHAGEIWSIAFSPDGQTLASGSSDNTIKLWSPIGELRRTLSGHSAAVRAIAISPSGLMLVSGSSDKTIKLWNLPSGELLYTLSGHQDRVISLALSPDAQILASGSVDRTIKIWDLSSGRLVRTLAGHSDWVNAVAISPDGQTLASGIGDMIKVWDLNTGKLLQTLSGHSSDITSLSFSANGKMLVSGSGDQTIKVWQL